MDNGQTGSYKDNEYTPFMDDELKDVLQKAIELRLSYHERPGFNAQNYTKVIVHNTLFKMNEWIEKNRDSAVDYLH